MKSIIKILLPVLLPVFSMAQVNPLLTEPTQKQADSLQLLLKRTTNDTIRMAALRECVLYYIEKKADSAFYFIEQALPLAKKLQLKLREADVLDLYGVVLNQQGNYPKALQILNEAIKIAVNKESEKNIWRISKFANDQNPQTARLNMLATIQLDMGGVYGAAENPDKELISFEESIKTSGLVNDFTIPSIVYHRLGSLYLKNNKIDSAVIFFKKSIDCANKSGYKTEMGNALIGLGRVYLQKRNFTEAKKYFYDAIKLSEEQHNIISLGTSYIFLSKFFTETGIRDSALYYGKLGLAMVKSTGRPLSLIAGYSSLADIYKNQHQLDSAFIYLQLASSLKDSFNTSEKVKQFQNIGFDEQLRLQEFEKEKIQTANKIRTYAMLAGLGVFLLIGLLLYRNNRQKQKANSLLASQKQKVESTLSELKSTQVQLIQSEKMASLGELTAGIAHEIQNPLNFVNNFSEVNKEMLAELNEEIDKGNYNDAKAIAKDVIANEEKINHHGKRAGDIVKGMLQHSRTSAGQKEPTDINALCDEYLRLSYHGLKAKDKEFNADFKTDFDNSIGRINIIPQDIGRVLLNLYNNAFYAMNEKKKQHPEGYEPTVSVQTKKLNDKVEIKVSDNGSGIPRNVVDKIFQPFYTTKPTGEGTGLGLSLSYDIIKAHSGEIKVETKEGEGAEFTILLPAN